MTASNRAKRKHQQRVFSTEQIEEHSKKHIEAMDAAFDLLKVKKPTNINKYINDLRSALEGLLRTSLEVRRDNHEALERLVAGPFDTPNQGLKWKPEEDGAMLERRADGWSFESIGSLLGRSSAACATRLSVIAGIPRSQMAEMYIDGTLNDELEIRGIFRGLAQRR